jgi:serine/threonine-protein kinase
LAAAPLVREPVVGPVVAAAADPLVGTLIDRYRIKDVLGTGGMGTVYRVVHERMQKIMALKMLNPSLSADPVVRQRFRREARAASLLESHNTVAVFDFGETPSGALYLVMEYLRGRTLAAELTRVGRLAPARAVHVLAQVLRSLEEAHAQGIVHRDIKPDNIFLVEGDEPDYVKVLDFGIAKGERLGESLPPVSTRSDLVVGTPEYMAPEQARGHELDGRADLWAVGVVLYECLVGRIPFSAPTPVDVLVALMERPVPLPWDVAPEVVVPPSLWRVVERALQKNARQRFASATEMREALLAAGAEAGVGALPGRVTPVRGPAESADDVGIAGREEWDLFEREQRRRRVGLAVFSTAVVAAAVVGALTLVRPVAPVTVEEEPNNAVHQANLVAPGTVRGVVAGAEAGKGDRDVYVMPLPRGDHVLSAMVVPLTPTSVTLGLSVWVAPPGAGDAKLVWSGFGKALPHPRVPNLTVGGDRLYLMVREESRVAEAPPSAVAVEYRLEVQPLRPRVEDEERENNSGRDVAELMTPGRVVNGWLSPPDDEDWFKVPVPSDDREMQAEVNPVPELAVDVSFFDADGRRAVRKTGKLGERVVAKISVRRCGAPCYVVLEAAGPSTLQDPAYRLTLK